MREYLTISEIEKRTGLSNRTCQHYFRTFDPFFIMKSCNREKKYESTAVAILCRIRDLYNNDQAIDEINSILINEFPIVINNFDEQETIIFQGPSFATSDTLLEDKQRLEKRKDFMNQQQLRGDVVEKSEVNIKKKNSKGLFGSFFGRIREGKLL